MSDPYLYHTPQHLQNQAHHSIIFFYLFRDNFTPAIAGFQCATYDNFNWISPPRAPFGGIQVSDDSAENDIQFFLDCIVNYIQQQGGVSITIKLFASIYQINKDISINHLLLHNNFIQHESLINHHISVTSSSFVDKITKTEQKKLMACRDAGFYTQLLLNPNPEDLHNFLTNHRNKRGYNVSLNRLQFTSLLTRFPTDIKVFRVYDKNEPIAQSVTVRVNSRVLYNFLSVSTPEYDRWSPSVLLLSDTYRHCQNSGISVLDLGTSLDHDGQEKPGLIRFKENVGGIRGTKDGYFKKLTTSDVN